MKKTSLIFSIILMLFLLTSAVFAEETAILGDTTNLNEITDPTEGADSDGFVITDGVLIKYVGESPDPIVPQNVTHISAGAFTHTKNLKSVLSESNVLLTPVLSQEESRYTALPQRRYMQ